MLRHIVPCYPWRPVATVNNFLAGQCRKFEYSTPLQLRPLTTNSPLGLEEKKNVSVAEPRYCVLSLDAVRSVQHLGSVYWQVLRIRVIRKEQYPIVMAQVSTMNDHEWLHLPGDAPQVLGSTKRGLAHMRLPKGSLRVAAFRRKGD